MRNQKYRTIKPVRENKNQLKTQNEKQVIESEKQVMKNEKRQVINQIQFWNPKETSYKLRIFETGN